ncbi:CDP-alcohol phosphatidyltransferase family protein [Sphingomonas aracearum]|uniref:CDP-alcohol phosphatidyltransferase family protein n=2 Tax=Sphingomonas aracearum TaxID=2283317 RepID=A0A369W2G6_9SPHN|nr:CDP-alcohol phosphatidyltransferase family protein [Sphingomonas aracearum]
MTPPPADGSRDRRIEDPTNLWIIHPASRALLPRALRLGISANAVSVAGLVTGALAALAYYRGLPLLGLLLCAGWLIADGLDGMIARATKTASALGRFLDGLCDHGVFALLYIALAASVGTGEAWAFALAAAAFHAVQSSIYEGERTRYHRRTRGLPRPPASAVTANGLVRFYDLFANALDRVGAPADAALDQVPGLRGRYAALAVPPMRLMALEAANARVIAIFVAVLLGNPYLFWGFEIVVQSIVLVAAVLWHRRAENRINRAAGMAAAPSTSLNRELGLE